MKNTTSLLARRQNRFSKFYFPTALLIFLTFGFFSLNAYDRNEDSNLFSKNESMYPKAGGVEIQLTIIDEGCEGQVGILSIEVNDEVTYLWSTGETTETIMITENGTYGVTLFVVGTTGTYTDTIEVTELNTGGPSYSGYTLLALEEVKLSDRNTVLSGAVGVTDSDGKVKLEKNTNVYSFVQASKVEIDNTSYADAVIISQAEMDLPDFIYNTFSDDAEDLKVEENETMTISGNLYKKIELKKNAKLIIESANVFAKEIKTEDGAIIEFTGCTNIILEKGMSLYKNNIFNPSGENVEIYADYSVSVKEGSSVIANIYANDHDIKAEGKNNNPTTMSGFFSGKKIEGKYYVTWEFGSLCSPCPVVYPESPTGECECKGGMTQLTIDYSGGAGANLSTNSGVVTDNGDGTYTINTAANEDKLEKAFEISDGNTTGEIHTSCSKDILGNTYGGGFTVLGYIDTENNVSTIETCPVSIECDCSGGMTQLTILYSGGAGANLTVNSGIVQDNGDSTYTINTAPGEDKLEKAFEINDGQNLGEIHTSCSKDILGFTFANVYTVIGHIDSNGHVCSIDPNAFGSVDIPIIAYPNPTKSSFNLYVQSQKDLNNIKVSVFSITNQSVLELTIHSNTTYSVGEKLQPGFYLVRVEMEDQVKVLKLIKN